MTCPQVVPYEPKAPVYFCRQPVVKLKDAWPKLRAPAFLNG